MVDADQREGKWQGRGWSQGPGASTGLPAEGNAQLHPARDPGVQSEEEHRSYQGPWLRR